MRYLLCVVVLLIMMSGCTKIIERPGQQNTKVTSYLQVSCENCHVGYGMPDQYKAFDNAGGLSVKFPYTYKEGYNLQVQITAAGKSQDLGLRVYDADGNVLYSGSATKEASAQWGVSVLLTDDK